VNRCVFVSSTFVDLKDHRLTVQKAIKQLGAVDISMENFGARDERPKKECLRIIGEECDTFVGYMHTVMGLFRKANVNPSPNQSTMRQGIFHASSIL